MKFDKFGNPIYQEKDLIDIIYQNKIDFVDQVLVEESEAVEKFAKHSDLPLNIYKELDSDLETFDQICQSEWFLPSEYQNLDIHQIVLDTCSTDYEKARCLEELAEFKARNMLDLLRWLKYIMDTCRSNNIIWGVGRGSSVASYVLFKLGIHRIDSIKYNLDWREFLR
jgi:DNA polymerase-3 subunit alpha